MTRTIEVDGEMRIVATEKELLDFANAIRQAGGADVIEALLPSTPIEPESCLIANALNFGCRVVLAPDANSYFADGAPMWQMVLPKNLTDEQRKALNRVKGVRLRMGHHPSEGQFYYLTLPKHIGNAAKAFDYGAAFQEYVQEAA